MKPETETITRYVQRDKSGRVVAVVNEYAAAQGIGEAESVTVPTESDVRAALGDILDDGWAVRRCADYLTWEAYPTRPRRRGSAHVSALIKSYTGWRVRIDSSGAGAYFWPEVQS